MNDSVLQVPISKELRDKSEKVAKSSGFSSLQEVVRLFLKKFSNKELEIGFEMPKYKLSAKNEKRYMKMVEDYEKGINIVKTDSAKDFFAKLNSDQN